MKLPPLVQSVQRLSNDELRRYSRQIVIPNFSIDGQSRLRNAKVLVIGAGGLGSPALLYLAAAGVGTVGVIDFDSVDESNLHRQILFGQSDIGKNKAETAKIKLRELNPFVDVIAFPIKLDVTNAIEIFEGFDVIVDASDNFATRYLINDAAVLLNKPNVWGSVNRFDGQVGVFWNIHGPCYRCLHPVPPAPETVENCAEAGVLGVVCAAVASMQVNEVIKLVTGTGEVQIGQLMIFDALNSQNSKVEIRKNPQCPICSQNPTQKSLLKDYEDFCGVKNSFEINAHALNAKISRGDDFMLIDVREPEEHELSFIPGSVLVPKNYFLDSSVLAQLPKEKEIILYCRSGVRSAQCLEIIHSAGFTNSRHLAGGILAWERL